MNTSWLIQRRTGLPVPEQRLIPALLIAAAMNAEGNLDLAVAPDGMAVPGARIEFFPGSEGEVLQRLYWTVPSQRFSQVVLERKGEVEPLDMILLAGCLTHTFGVNTPRLFQLAHAEEGKPPRLMLAGEERDRQRLEALRSAFNIYLLAYEERLV